MCAVDDAATGASRVAARALAARESAEGGCGGGGGDGGGGGVGVGGGGGGGDGGGGRRPISRRELCELGLLPPEALGEEGCFAWLFEAVSVRWGIN